MLYKPPPKWTEKLLNELPFGEDDRYERKSGQDIIGSKSEFFHPLATEIGAFDRRFWGSLFIGINDDRIIAGVPKLVTLKGQLCQSSVGLKAKSPTLLEMRLQHLRVSSVGDLSEETFKVLGPDNTIIAVDVFDSELAPHQCVFNHKYYYRVNSESRPALHHYLAFLWGRD